MNHYEKNKKAVAMSRVIKKESQAKGVPPFMYILGEQKYHNILEISGLAASYADIKDAYESSETTDYSSVVRNKKTQDFVSALASLTSAASDFAPTGYGKETAPAAIGQFNICYQMLNYEKHGKHCYTVSDGLATLLALTELRGLKCEDMKLPHPCLYLEIPENLGFKIRNVVSGWHRAEGIYISEDTKDSGRTSGIIAAEPDNGRCWRVCVVGAPNETATHPLDDALVYFTIPLVEGWNADDSVRELVNRVHSNEATDPGLRIETEESIGQWLAIFRWALNVMVYATTPDAEHETIRANPDAESIWRRIQKLPKGNKRDDLKNRLKAMDQMERTLLGRSVKLTPALRSMAEHKANSGNGKPLLVRTLVSGHWQRFATGEGRKDRTWKFRQPFWRGPDGAPEADSHEHRLS